jgi:hypothetical protein
MKLSFATSTAAICLLTSTAFAAPTTMTDAQMAQIVAAGGPGHQSAAADLKGGVAALMPAHVLGLGEGEFPGNAHQSGASGLKGAVADLMPDHVRMNP